jgi:hypothetical protein
MVQLIPLGQVYTTCRPSPYISLFCDPEQFIIKANLRSTFAVQVLYCKIRYANGIIDRAGQFIPKACGMMTLPDEDLG